MGEGTGRVSCEGDNCKIDIWALLFLAHESARELMWWLFSIMSQQTTRSCQTCKVKFFASHRLFCTKSHWSAITQKYFVSSTAKLNYCWLLTAGCPLLGRDVLEKLQPGHSLSKIVWCAVMCVKVQISAKPHACTFSWMRQSVNLGKRRWMSIQKLSEHLTPQWRSDSRQFGPLCARLAFCPIPRISVLHWAPPCWEPWTMAYPTTGTSREIGEERGKWKFMGPWTGMSESC